MANGKSMSKKLNVKLLSLRFRLPAGRQGFDLTLEIWILKLPIFIIYPNTQTASRFPTRL